MPFARVVHRAQSTAGVPLAPSAGARGRYPLDNASYIQEAGRDDTVTGAIDLVFSATCEPPRVAAVYVLVRLARPIQSYD